MFEWATTQKLSDKANDKLARKVLDRFRSAALWQGQERVGGVSLRETLERCWNQYHGVWEGDDLKLIEKLRVNARINLTALKADVVRSFLGETLIQADSLPWAVAPTPLPDMSDHGREEILGRVKEAIFRDGALLQGGNLEELARRIKNEMKAQTQEEAKLRARAMEELMRDQCAEGGWRTALYTFLGEFSYQPFAILHGPVPARRPTLEWAGDNLRVKEKIFYEFQPVSVFDFWYSPDSPDTQRGAGVFIRQRWTRPRLLSAGKMKSYFGREIYNLLKTDMSKTDFRLRWLADRSPDQPEAEQKLDWVNGVGTVDALLHYGRFSGRELSEYGLKGLDRNDYYDATVTVIGGRTVQVFVAPNPSVALRPVHTASFYRTRDRIPGAGLAQRLRDVERCFLRANIFLMRNAANAAEPITEADYRRLSKFMSEDDLFQLSPGSVYLADSDGLPNAAPALRFHTVPAVMGNYQSLLEFYLEWAHLATNVPAALHGTAVGTGANRTFRGAALLQGNAIKAIQSAVGNIDHGVFYPCGELLFNYNMLYEDDEDIRGDCRVLAQGVQGLLAREMNRNNALELLQLVAQSGAALGERGPRIFAWAINQVLTAMDVPAELLDSTGGSAPQMAQGTPQGPQPGGPPMAAHGVPNGNPPGLTEQ